MGRALEQMRRRKAAATKLAALWQDRQHVLVVHYSCESFYDRDDGRTPRATSIAVRHLGSAQTESFSIHKIAEQRQLAPSEITSHYDSLERQMLTAYFDYVRMHSNYMWLHWNMRNIKYGFQALAHRHTTLGGTPYDIGDSKKFDLARELVEIYGDKYIGHPRLEKLVAKNEITDRDFLTGKLEAAAFENGEYVKLHQSTLRKVDVLSHIVSMAAANTLLTDATWRDRYGVHPVAVIEVVKEHWGYSALGGIVLVFGLVRGFGALF